MTLYKKNAYFVIITLFITICFIMYGYFFRNSIEQPNLPKKYLAYKSLEDTIKSAHYEIVSLQSYPVSLNAFHFSPLSESVVFESNKKGFSGEYDEYRLYYKFNNKAKLTDSLITKRYDSYKIFKSYLLSREDYITWIIDNDTIRNTYIELNADLKWTPEHIKSEYDKLCKKASSLYCFKGSVSVHDSGNPALNIDKNLFLIDKKWHALYGNDLYLEPATEKQIKTEVTNSPVYTHKLSKHGENLWMINAYYNLIIKNDTLKIKEEVWSDRSDLVYYRHPEYPDFCILASSGCFFIKPKK
ncbi:hypothetical protein [Flavobacterium panacagri]|uniref:hypothetical protein n=1 Tax=Flavobacterium panacagri TaxID=3034146 RepID=UPI0025A54042|nr:hypothetical protein [Flavobacterium panacagri]